MVNWQIKKPNRQALNSWSNFPDEIITSTMHQESFTIITTLEITAIHDQAKLSMTGSNFLQPIIHILNQISLPKLVRKNSLIIPWFPCQNAMKSPGIKKTCKKSMKVYKLQLVISVVVRWYFINCHTKMTAKQAFSANFTLFQKKREANNIPLMWTESAYEHGMKRGLMSSPFQLAPSLSNSGLQILFFQPLNITYDPLKLS